MTGDETDPRAGDRGETGGATVWTDEQRRAIERRQGDLLLDAAAGSGKTSVLVERFVRSVLEDGVGVEAILTITFTEKAAAELRDRIRARLRAVGADAAARATDGAYISTIHGFCARVLRAHAVEAGLDPRFEVLDRVRVEPLVTAAFDGALQALPERFGARAAVDLVAAYGAPTLRNAIVAVHDQLRSAGEIAPRLPPLAAVESDAVDAAAAALRAAAAEVAGELGAVADPGVSVRRALAAVAQIRELGDVGELWPADLWRLRLPRAGTALASDACVAYGEALVALRGLLGAALAGPLRDLLDGLLDGFASRYAAAKAELSGVDFEDLELLTRRLWGTEPTVRDRYRDRFAAIMVDELQDTNRVQLELIEAIAADDLFTVGDAQQSIYGFRHADVELFRARGRRLAARGAWETLRTNFRTRPEIIDVLNPTFAEAMGDDYTPLRAGRSPGGDDGPRVELLIADKGADWDLEGMAAPWRLAEARGLAARVGELVADGVAAGEIVLLLRAASDMRVYERALERLGLATYVIGGRGYWAHPQVVDMLAYLRALANPCDEEALYGVLASPLVGISLDGLVVLAAAARGGEGGLWATIREGGPALAELAVTGVGTTGAVDDGGRLVSFAGWFAGERERMARAGVEELLERALTLTGYDLTMLAMPGGRRRLANVRKLMRLGSAHAAAHGPDLRGFLTALEARVHGGGDGAREGEAPVEGEGLDAIRLMTIHRAKGLEFPVVCVADLGRSPRPPSTIVRVGSDGRLGLRLARAGAGGRESALDYRALGEETRAADEQEERRLFYVAMTRARERLLLSGAAKLDAWVDGGGRGVGGGPIAWIAPALVPELATAIGAGGGDLVRGEGRLSLRLVRPEPDGGAAGDAEGMVAGAGAPAAGGPPIPGPGPSAAGPSVAGPPPAPIGGLAGLDPPRPAVRLSYSVLAAYRRCGYRFYAERVLGLPPGMELEDPFDGDGADDPERGPAEPGRPVSRAVRRGILAHALLERLDFRRPLVPDTVLARAAARRAGLEPAPGPEELDGLAALVRSFAESELCARLARARDVRREQRFTFALPASRGPSAVSPGSMPGVAGLPAAAGMPGVPGGASWLLLVGALDVLAIEPTRAGGPAAGAMLIVDYKTDRLRGERPDAIVERSYGDQQLVYALAALHAGAPAVEVVHCFLDAPADPVAVHFSAADRVALEARVGALAAGVREHRFEVAPDPHRRLCAGCPAEGGLCSWPLEQTRRESADTLF